MVEQIWLSHTDAHKLEVNEVYDVFFRLPPSTPQQLLSNFKLLLLSPHELIDGDKQIAVTMERYPGSGSSRFDQIYMLGSKYDHAQGSFSVNLRAAKEQFVPVQETCTGKVLDPTISIPHRLDDQSIAVMGRLGTILELDLGRLTANEKYAMRIVVKPHRLNLEFAPSNRPDADGTEGCRWEQPLEVFSPTILERDFRQILKHLDSRPNSQGAVTPLVRVLEEENEFGAWKLALVRHHRLFLIYRADCSIIQQADPGCVWYVGPAQIPVAHEQQSDQRVHIKLMEWAGGTATYWVDDPYEIAKHVAEHMAQFGSDEKKKEDITSSFNSLRHENTGLIVDALVRLHCLKESAGGQYTIGSTNGDVKQLLARGEWDERFQAISVDRTVLDGFWFAGFQVKYSYEYTFETESYRQRRIRKHHLEDISFWSGVFGLAVAVLGLALSLWVIGPVLAICGTLIVLISMAFKWAALRKKVGLPVVPRRPRE
jgi:hypothetical protein